MKKKYFILGLPVLLLIALFYVAFQNDNTWQVREGRAFSDVNFLENSAALDMIEKQIDDVDYAAIVYATHTRMTPNNWFHRVIMKNPHDSTYYEIKAEADHIIVGSYDKITYASASQASNNSKSPKPAFATLVLLCGDSENALYAPDNGYEFAVSKELYDYLKARKKVPSSDKKSSICPE